MSSMPVFDIPKGFTPDEEVEQGQTFRYLGEACITPEGQICLVSMDGAKFEDKKPGMEEETETTEEVKDDGGSFDEKLEKQTREMGWTQ